MSHDTTKCSFQIACNRRLCKSSTCGLAFVIVVLESSPCVCVVASNTRHWYFFSFWSLFSAVCPPTQGPSFHPGWMWDVARPIDVDWSVDRDNGDRPLFGLIFNCNTIVGTVVSTRYGKLQHYTTIFYCFYSKLAIQKQQWLPPKHVPCWIN